MLDPAFAPGTGTAEPGGLMTRELLYAARTIASEVDLCVMDLVEVSPPYDPTGITAMAGHRVVLRDALRHGAAPQRRAGAPGALVTELVAYADLADDPLVRSALAGDADGRRAGVFAEAGGLAGVRRAPRAGSAGPFARAARAGLADEARRCDRGR